MGSLSILRFGLKNGNNRTPANSTINDKFMGVLFSFQDSSPNLGSMSGGLGWRFDLKGSVGQGTRGIVKGLGRGGTEAEAEAEAEDRLIALHGLDSKFIGLANKRHWLCTMKDLTPIFL